MLSALAGRCQLSLGATLLMQTACTNHSNCGAVTTFFVTLHVIMIMAFCLYCCAVDPDLCVFHRNIRAIHLPSSGTHNSALDRQPLFNLRYCRAGDCAAVVWLKLAGVPKFQLTFDACAIFVNVHDIMFRVFLEIQLFFRNSFKCTLDRAVSICMTINSRCLARA